MTDVTLLSASSSRYVSRALAARPTLAAAIARLAAAPLTRERIDARFDALCEAARGEQAMPDEHPLPEEALKKALRQLRTEVFCAVMERDLSGVADVAEVTGTMTDLAETRRRSSAHWRCCPPISKRSTSQPRGPGGEPLTLGVVGMGKLGGRELNVSVGYRSDLRLWKTTAKRRAASARPSRRRTFSRGWASG